MGRKITGFTLIELLVAVVILSILTVLAVPSFRDMIARNRVTSQANQLLQFIVLARSEAIRRNRTVWLCITPNGSSCSTTATDWATGVMLYTDVDGDGLVEAGDVVIRAQQPFGQGIAITDNVTLKRVGFSPRGLSANARTWTLEPSSSSSTALQKTLTLSVTGRPRIN